MLRSVALIGEADLGSDVAITTRARRDGAGSNAGVADLYPRIYEGATEIQRLVVAGESLKEG